MPRSRSPHPRFDASDPLLDGKPAATLDLHGFSAHEAEPALRAFLKSWKARVPGALVHVITGRGRASKSKPVLKPIVKRVLQNLPPGMVRDWALTSDEGGYRIWLL